MELSQQAFEEIFEQLLAEAEQLEKEAAANRRRQKIMDEPISQEVKERLP